LPDAKKCGDEFLGEGFHYLAQRAQRARRQSSLPTSNFTSHFRLPTSRFLLRISRRAHRGRGGNRHFLRPTLLHTSDFTLPTSFALRPHSSASLAGIAKQHQGHYQNPHQLHAHGVEHTHHCF